MITSFNILHATTILTPTVLEHEVAGCEAVAEAQHRTVCPRYEHKHTAARRIAAADQEVVASGLLVKTLALFSVEAAGTSVPLPRYIYTHAFLPLASPKNASLLYAAANLAILFALLAWMYRRRLFLRV